MNIGLLVGEVKGKDLINIGETVTVTYNKNNKIVILIGRLNNASKEEIKVGSTKIKVEDPLKIKKW